MRVRPAIGLGLALIAVLTTAVRGAENVPEFLGRHWRAPIPFQGPPPARFTPLEASLQPESCGSCHPAQFADWSTSWHAKAMGQGVSGQLMEMLERDPATALGCFGCHAPLAEQAPLVLDGARFRKNPLFDGPLRAKGLVCAGCHVRQHERFGPPRRDGSLTSAGPRGSLPHGGVTRTPAFLVAEFCQGCHQFGPEGLTLDGKPVENTYNEWKGSRFAREGVQCQNCHMPDRRHLWKGIHDPDMVRSGLTIAVRRGADRYRPGDVVTVALRVENTRVGHAFPTYVTPRVVLRAELLDPSGAVIDGSRQERVIAREVTLDLSRELFDTRLLPGQSVTLEYRRQVEDPGVRARLSVIVYPDAFYTRFFQSLLEQGAGRGQAEIRRALEATRESPFTVFVEEVPLT